MARGGVVDARVKQEVAELALIRRIQLDDNSSYDLLFGIRNWDNELRVKLTPDSDFLGQRKFRIEPSWTDGYIGG